MTGEELRAHRKAAGLSQVALAQRAVIGRDAVSYWERKAHLAPRGWAVTRMVKALGLDHSAVFRHTNARARGWGVSPWEETQAQIDAEVKKRLTELAVREAQRAARRRVRCGAKTRKDAPCKNMSEPGRRRCKFHGGKSTGPRTAEGKARIAEAQRRRWAAHQPLSAISLQSR